MSYQIFTNFSNEKLKLYNFTSVLNKLHLELTLG